MNDPKSHEMRPRSLVWKIRLRSVGLFVASALKKITLKMVGFAIVIVPVCLYVYREVTRDVLIVDPFTVPKSFEDVGLTPNVLANRIGAEIRRIETSAAMRLKLEDLTYKTDETPTPDIEIPGTNVGLKTVIDVTRDLFRIYPRHISGDVVFPFAPSADTSARSIGKQVTATIYVSRGHDRAPSVSITADGDNTTMLVQRIAEAALGKINQSVFAMYQYRRGNYQAVEAIVSQITRDASADRAHKVLAYSLWGMVLEAEGKIDEDIAMQKLAIGLDPSNATAHNNWGIALMDNRHYVEAIHQYEQAIERDPKWALPYNNWGIVLRNQGKYDDAIAKYRQAVDLDPNEPRPYNNWCAFRP